MDRREHRHLLNSGHDGWMTAVSREPWDYDRYCDVFEIEARRFASAVAGADPETPVRTCPGWTIGDLIKHHGSSERRVEVVVRSLSQLPVLSNAIANDLPDERAQYAAWFAAGVAPLVKTLRAADPMSPVWTNGVDQHVRYWARRILFEAAVHRADAELALGIEPLIDRALAADGIGEFLTNLLSFPWVAKRLRAMERDGQVVQLSATDSDERWTITMQGDGFSWDQIDTPASATAAGRTPDLFLLTYGRLPVSSEEIRASGDLGLLTEWLQRSAL